MSRETASEDFLAACASGNRDDALLALDQGANPNATWDESGNPAWWLWLAHEQEVLPDDQHLEVFEAMLDAGLKITHGTLSTFCSLIEDRRPACALPLLLSLQEDHLKDFLENHENFYDNNLQWWGAVYADHQARLLDEKTPTRSSSTSSPRL